MCGLAAVTWVTAGHSYQPAAMAALGASALKRTNSRCSCLPAESLTLRAQTVPSAYVARQIKLSKGSNAAQPRA